MGAAFSKHCHQTIFTRDLQRALQWEELPINPRGGWALTCRQMRVRYPHTSAFMLFRALASERASSASTISSSLRERGEGWTKGKQQAEGASELNRLLL